MSFIFSDPNNKYQLGKEKGIRDGEKYYKTKKGKRNPTTFTDMFKRLHWSEKEYKAFIKGYFEGFDFKYNTLELNESIKSSLKTSENFNYISENFSTFNKQNSTSMNDLQVILEKLKELNVFLHNFKKVLDDNRKGYNGRIEQLHKDGLSIQDYNNFTEMHLKPTNQMISQLIMFIEKESIPYVNRNIEKEVERIKTSGGG